MTERTTRKPAMRRFTLTVDLSTSAFGATPREQRLELGEILRDACAYIEDTRRHRFALYDSNNTQVGSGVIEAAK